MDEKKVLYKIKPNFNIIYEMFMPTGKKIKRTLLVLVLVVVCYFFLGAASEPFRANLQNVRLTAETGIDVYSIFNNVIGIIIIALALKLIAHLVIQIWQYNCISYTFYDDYLEYEDTFLNQHRKTLMYNNVKEIEIKRTVWDRLNGYGIIVIYTNAEKSDSNGLVIYALRDPQKNYEKIYEIIHKKIAAVSQDDEDNNEKINILNGSNDISEREKSFRDSLNQKE